MNGLRPGTRLFVVMAGVCLLATEADARVGGGQGFGGGTSSPSGTGGAAGDAEAVVLLIRLLIVYPEIGVPLTLVLFGAWAWNRWANGQDGDHVVRASGLDSSQGTTTVTGRRRTTFARLTEADPTFSAPAFIDFAQMVHARCWAAAAASTWAPLEPFITTSARRTLDAVCSAAAPTDIVLGGITVVEVDVTARHQRVDIAMVVSMTLGEQRIAQPATWTFTRPPGTQSLAPAVARQLGCPACGSAVETDSLGACTSCGTPLTEGHLQWRVAEIALGPVEVLGAPLHAVQPSGVEVGATLPSVVDPDLATHMRAFQGRHPDFDLKAWEARLHHIFYALQQAWSNNRWSRARPYTTDRVYQSLRFTLERYQEHGLANRLEEVKILKMQVVRLELDAWYETITVRFWARMRDFLVEVDSDTLQGGSDRSAREMSEYWTFIRAVGSGGHSADPECCPACGGALDNVEATGACGYCGSIITTGHFDWVLHRIDQPEAWT